MTDSTLSLADLGVTDDPGTSWHPTKHDAATGDFPDLNDAQAAEHRLKPERRDQVDGFSSLAAEDSAETDQDVI